jgi:hypothetical protein
VGGSDPDRQGLHCDQVIGSHCVRDCLAITPSSEVLEATSRERRYFVQQTGAEVALEVRDSLIRGDEAAQPVGQRLWGVSI